MSNTLTGTVQNLELTGPLTVQKEGRNKGKLFHIHTLTVNGVKLKQFDFRDRPEAPATLGDKVDVIFTTTGNGKTLSNSITEIKVLLDDAKGTSNNTYTETTNMTTSTPATKTTSHKQTYNTSGDKQEETQLRISRSHAITTAINLLQLQGNKLADLETVIELAEQVKHYTLNGRS